MTPPTAPERCPTCDKPKGDQARADAHPLAKQWSAWIAMVPGQQRPLRWRDVADAQAADQPGMCIESQCQPVDWRARALTAEARIATVAAAVEHDVAVKRSHDDARSAGGQTVGTGGPLTPAPQSVLRYLDRVVLRLSDPRIRTIADDADRWAKVAPLIERLRAIDAEANRSKTTGTRVHELRVEHFDTVRALLAATEPTP